MSGILPFLSELLLPTGFQGSSMYLAVLPLRSFYCCVLVYTAVPHLVSLSAVSGHLHCTYFLDGYE